MQRGTHGPVRTPTHTSRPARVPNDSALLKYFRSCAPFLHGVASFSSAFVRLLAVRPAFGQLIEDLTDLVTVLGTKTVRFEQMHHEETRLPPIDLIDQVLK